MHLLFVCLLKLIDGFEYAMLSTDTFEDSMSIGWSYDEPLRDNSLIMYWILRNGDE